MSRCPDTLAADAEDGTAHPPAQRARTLSILATRGGFYLTARYGLSILVSIGNMFVLTRWIGPHAYGLFVTAVGLTTFLASVTRFGVDTYLVRCEPAPDRRQYDVAFTLILINSVVLTGLGAACVPLLERWYAADEFTAPYLVLLLTVPLTGVAGLPMAKLERALNFQSVASIELGGQILAFATAATLAWRGAGVWAPVTGLFFWQIFALLAASVVARFSPTLAMRARDARQMLTFGFGFAASMRVWQLRSLVNPLLVGRFVGTEGVAMVAFALRVAEGIGFVRTAAGRLAIAALTRMQSDRDHLSRALEHALELQVVILGPLLCTFGVLGPWLVPPIVGARWTGALTVYPFVAIGVLLSSVFNLEASALFVVGKQWAVLRSYACHVGLLALASFLFLPRLGIAAYGWGEILACAGYFFIHSALSRVVPISYRGFLPWLVLFVAILAVAAGWAVLIVLGVALVAAFITMTSVKGHRELSQITSIPSSSFRVAVRRICTFAAKTKLRGWRYVGGIVRFQLTSQMYRCRWALKRAHAFIGGRSVRKSAASIEAELRVIPIESATRPRRFHFKPSDIPQIVERIPDHLKKRTVDEANHVVAHRFLFRGREKTFPLEVDWYFCPCGNLSWQWDLNRHRFFLTLAAAYFYTGEHRYMAKLVALWRLWLQTNPVAEGGNWKYPFEVAARLQNWMWAYFLLAYSRSTSRLDLRQLETALLEHALYVADHLEYHWPNNHLLLEAKALYEFALLFPDLDVGGKFRNRAHGVLGREIMKQVLPDGSHAELSSMYHRIVAGELQELRLLTQRLASPLAEPIAGRIRLMNSFSQAMLRPDGSVPLLGDSAAEDTYLRFDPTHPDYSDLNYWLSPDLDDRSLSDVVTTTQLQVFPDAGYAFLYSRENQTHIAFDFGRFSCCETANHAHSDALSFELWTKGQPVVIDPGIYLPWDDSRNWGDYFRSTGAHNTVEIDSKSQSELSPFCDVRRTARNRLLREVSWDGHVAVTAECVPYWSNGHEVRHTREISLRAERLKIHDRVDGVGCYPMAWSFQFAPQIELVDDQGMLAGRASGKRIFTLATQMPQQLRRELFCGNRYPMRGWISRNSFEVVPAPLARFSLRANLPFETEFAFSF